MTKYEMVNVVVRLNGFRHYLTAGNPIWDTDEVERIFDTAVEALEKQIPKHYAIHNGGYDCEGTFLGSTNCSSCDHELEGFEDYCPNCGQAISWEKDDD